ncbi:ABC transporter ATP-binding protein [Oceanicoccus sp. KOV_DT_Chl]|uniref:ABC transporter ATP-binding protein n=1 Tax=Oceanicoccus sp. KOV_DT_Chl TaxID=1904639 RepID=UPI000C7C8493|nr:ABC transporter ATP-binding protein [Oceanicoccus sp. KOV_DT_Chl]
MDQPELIKLRGINKVFYTEELETWALNDIDITINQGEYVSISGASGCGKSTLLSVLGLLDTPTEGHYFLNGEDVSDLNANRRAAIRNREIGFIFQAFNLIGDMNVYENVELPLTYRKDLSKQQRKQRVEDALEKVDMSHRIKHFPAQLSGGQQQRVAIARALAGQPKVLLADEPTGNLDSTNAAMVMALLDTLHQQGSTICMVTHDPRSAEQAQRQIVLLDGKIISDNTLSNADKAEVA